MIVKHHSYKYLLTSILLVIAIGLSACATPPTNSESASQIAELEAEIRQLEAENRQLRQQLQDIRNLVTSTRYRNTLSDLAQTENNSSDLAAFVQGLPDLPPLPAGVTVTQINNAIETALTLRAVLKVLPPPPLPFGPWQDLDDIKNEVISMTYWMEDLEDLPDFLASAESLEDLKARIEGYLGDAETTASDARDILEEVRDAAGS
jgi:chromosome segregation ATPase